MQASSSRQKTQVSDTRTHRAEANEGDVANLESCPFQKKVMAQPQSIQGNIANPPVREGWGYRLRGMGDNNTGTTKTTGFKA